MTTSLAEQRVATGEARLTANMVMAFAADPAARWMSLVPAIAFQRIHGPT